MLPIKWIATFKIPQVILPLDFEFPIGHFLNFNVLTSQNVSEFMMLIYCDIWKWISNVQNATDDIIKMLNPGSWLSFSCVVSEIPIMNIWISLFHTDSKNPNGSKYIKPMWFTQPQKQVSQGALYIMGGCLFSTSVQSQ